MKKRFVLEVELDGLPKTPNSIGRKHWTVKAQEARLWRGNVVWAVGSRKPNKPLKYAKLTYTRFSSAPVDADNLAASFKHVQDGLIDAGILANDRWENIAFPEYRWEKGPKGAGKIRILIEEVSGEELHGAKYEDGRPEDEAACQAQASRPGRGRKAKRISCTSRGRKPHAPASDEGAREHRL